MDTKLTDIQPTDTRAGMSIIWWAIIFVVFVIGMSVFISYIAIRSMYGTPAALVFCGLLLSAGFGTAYMGYLSLK